MLIQNLTGASYYSPSKFSIPQVFALFINRYLMPSEQSFSHPKEGKG
ncbi:MAG: hypothetical protein LVT47_00525 [Cyanobacteria bacterium LVE1205-1]